MATLLAWPLWKLCLFVLGCCVLGPLACWASWFVAVMVVGGITLSCMALANPLKRGCMALANLLKRGK